MVRDPFEAADPFTGLRAAIDAARASDRATFARRARNAAAEAILAAALSPTLTPGPPEHEPPELDDVVGPELAEALAELYRGSGDWTSRAIDVLEPLNALAHAE